MAHSCSDKRVPTAYTYNPYQAMSTSKSDNSLFLTGTHFDWDVKPQTSKLTCYHTFPEHVKIFSKLDYTTAYFSIDLKIRKDSLLACHS